MGLSAEDEFLEVTILEDLSDMQDDRIWSNPRYYYSDYEHFCILHQDAIAGSFLPDQEKHRQVCVSLR